MTTRKHNKFHARSRIQRAFLAWFEESRKQLKVPFKITKRCKKYIVLESTRSGLKVQGLLNSHGLHVSLYWQEGTECTVFWNEARTQLTSDGYECLQSSDPEEWGPQVYVHKAFRPYPRREDVWRVHLFEVFLEYINNTLTRFPWIEIYEIPGTAFVNGAWVSIPSDYGVGLLSSREEELKNPIVSSLLIGCDNVASVGPSGLEQEFPFFADEKNRNRQIIPSPLYIP